MKKVHNINEDYEDYIQRRKNKNLWSDIHLLFFIGGFLLIAAYFMRNGTMAIIGTLALVAWFFFFRSQLSLENRHLIQKYYPTACIIVSIIVFFFISRLMKLGSPTDYSADNIFNLLSFIAWIFFLMGTIVLIYRFFKMRKKIKN